MRKMIDKSYRLVAGILVFFTLSTGIVQAFSDVPSTAPFWSDAAHVENLGVIEGETFEPQKLITRGEYATWIMKNIGALTAGYLPQTKEKFSDVSLSDPAASSVYQLVDLGIISVPKANRPSESSAKRGSIKRLFKPNDPITKKDALRWILELHGFPIPKIFQQSQFQATDVSPKSSVASLVHKAIQVGLLQPGKVFIYKKLKRYEAAHYLRIIRSETPNLTVTILPTLESSLTRNPKFDILLNVWNRMLTDYLHKDNLKQEELIYAGIEGMVKEIGDKHSNFERPGDNALLESLSGEIEGIGAVIQQRDEEFVIIAPLKGSPAEKAGLQPHDVIFEVSGESTKGFTLTQVVGKIKGKKGTQVTLKIKRGTETMEFTITRDVIKIVSAEMERTTDNIAKITLSNFGERTMDEFIDIVEQLKQKPATKGIVLDLRSNPGGFLTTSITLSGYFIPRHERVATVKFPDHEEYENSNGNAELGSYPVIVLMNKGSASASEILAGALQDYGIAKVVGEQSYGKGTVQELSSFSDGSSLKLTIAEWQTAKGRSIEGKGITPDIVVPLTEEDRKAGRDPQMERAVMELRK